MQPQQVAGFINQLLQAAADPANKAIVPHLAMVLKPLIDFYFGLLVGFAVDPEAK